MTVTTSDRSVVRNASGLPAEAGPARHHAAAEADAPRPRAPAPGGAGGGAGHAWGRGAGGGADRGAVLGAERTRRATFGLALTAWGHDGVEVHGVELA